MLERALEATRRGLDQRAVAEAARRGAAQLTWQRWFANASAAWGL